MKKRKVARTIVSIYLTLLVIGIIYYVSRFMYKYWLDWNSILLFWISIIIAVSVLGLFVWSLNNMD